MDAPTTTTPAPFVRNARSDLAVILKTMEDHNVRGVEMPPNLIRAAVAAAAVALGSSNERVKAAGMKFVLGALQLNLHMFTEADRMSRLDGGMPTERTEHMGGPTVDLLEVAKRDREVLAFLMDRAEREDPILASLPRNENGELKR